MEPPAEDASDMDEEGHYFDFIAFYKKVEFSDRAIRLEILEESRQVLEPRGEASTSRVAPLPEVEEMPVNSIVIAAKSRVLRTMLSCGMRESDKSEPVVLKVTRGEKEGFKELLHFLYAGSLSPRFSETSTDIHEHINLLVVGDKYEVPSFMGAVVKCINKRERSISDSTTLVQGFPKVLEERSKIRKLIEEARAHIVSTFKDVSATWHVPNFLSLRFEAVEILLGSEDLEADSKEEILERVLAWLRENFIFNRERKELIAKLAPLARFTCIHGEHLVALLSYPEMKPVCTRRLITDALRFRAFSDKEKRKVEGAAFDRRGIQAVNLEMVGMFALSKVRESSETASVTWCGKTWYLLVSPTFGNGPPTVGVYLTCWNGDDDSDSAGVGVKARFCVFAKLWPDGLWKPLFQSSRDFNPQVGNETFEGEDDALMMSWDEARESNVCTGGTGVLTLKVEVRRLKLDQC